MSKQAPKIPNNQLAIYVNNQLHYIQTGRITTPDYIEALTIGIVHLIKAGKIKVDDLK